MMSHPALVRLDPLASMPWLAEGHVYTCSVKSTDHAMPHVRQTAIALPTANVI
jgi:hypothetical protein